MEFYDQSFQFINKYYFQLRNDENDTASVIYYILLLLSFIPLALTILISNIIIYINMNLIYSLMEHMQDNNKVNNYTNEVVSLRSLLVISIGINISLLLFHIFGTVNYIVYEAEIFHLRNTFVLYVVIYICCIVYMFFAFSSYYTYQRRHKKQSNSRLHSLLAASILLNIIYLGSFFFPYMLLAFIQDPLQTMFLYLVIAVLIISAYLLCVSFSKITGIFCKPKTALIIYITFSLAASIIFLVVVMLFILTLGSFNDFEEAQNLLVPLLVAMFGIFILKPTRHIYTLSQNLKEDDNNCKKQDGELIMNQITVQSNDDDANKQNEGNDNIETI